MKTDRELLKELEKKLGIKIAIIPNNVSIEKFFSESQSRAAFSDNEELLNLSIVGIDLLDIELLNIFSNLKLFILYKCHLQNPTYFSSMNQLTHLCLLHTDITDLKPISTLKKLAFLDLSSNQISDITPLKELTQLPQLGLNFNRINDISPLKSLTELTMLGLSGNHIKDITPVSSLTHLTNLDLDDNQIQDISPLASLTKLLELRLAYNHIRDVSPLSSLSQLIDLHLDDNQIQNISPLFSLTQLSQLLISANQINDIKPLTSLHKLNALNIAKNQIGKIRDLIKLPLLKYLHAYKNPIEDVPEEIYNRSFDAIKNYFKKLDEEDQDYLCEGRILFIGHPAAGKTTLVNKLIDPDYPVPNLEEKETVGIEITRWEFPTFKDYESFTLTTNLWDFGGRLIQLTLHQFFFTSDSLYVLLLDERNDNTYIDDWFNIITLLGESSPILVVLNEKYNNTTFDFSLELFRKRYKKIIIEEHRVDLSTNGHEWAVLKEKIQNMAAEIPLVGTSLPRKWVQIRKELEKHRSEHHLSYDKFLDICAQHEQLDRDDQLLLLRTFHKLGICLYFENDPDLSDIVFIDMQWLVDGLYAILRNDSLGQNDGLITIAELFNLYGNIYSEAEKRKLYLLKQKKRFDLCYPLDEEYILFPSLLPVDRPKAAIVPNGRFILRFRYQFKFLPKGIIPRLIVRLHHLINHENFREQIWRHGLKFSYKDASALCIQDTDRTGIKIIDITVASNNGIHDKALLAHLHISLEEILQTYPKLEFDRMVPCCCDQCLREPDTMYFHSYTKLEKFWKSGKTTESQCQESGEQIPILKLMEGVEDILADRDIHDNEVSVNEFEHSGVERFSALNNQAIFKTRLENKQLVLKNVIIVHTDIVDHVTLNNKLGEEAMHEIRTAHFDAGEKILAKHDGTLIKTAGDALYIIFDDSISAMRFTHEFRKNPGDSRINIRQVVCSGIVNLLENDIHGPTVSKCSRMAEYTGANEIIISAELKNDLDTIKPKDLRNWSWELISDISFKGFDDTKFNLWKNKL